MSRDRPSIAREGPAVPNAVRDTAAKQRRGREATGHNYAKHNYGTIEKNNKKERSLVCYALIGSAVL